MASKDTQIGLTLDQTDELRFIALKAKRINVGLQEGEKEELKILEAKGRQAK